MSIELRKLIFIFTLQLASVVYSGVNDSIWKSQPQLNISGYLDVYYVYDFNKPTTFKRQPFLYNHNRHNQINVNLAYIKLNANHEKYHGNIALQSGTYSNDNYTSEPGVLKNIFECNVGVSISKKNKWWFDVGVMPSYIGFESAVAFDNWTLTRSLLAENSPYFVTGAKLSFYPNIKWQFSALVMNGWQRIQQRPGSTIPSFGSQITYNIENKLKLNWSTFIGSDDPDTTRRMRYFSNMYSQFQVNKKLGIVLGFDIGVQQINKQSSTYNGWLSPVLISQFKFSDKWASACRVEYYSDKDGVIIPTTSSIGFNVLGLSLNGEYRPIETILIRAEGRLFHANDQIFIKSTAFSNQNFFVGLSIAFSLRQ